MRDLLMAGMVILAAAPVTAETVPGAETDADRLQLVAVDEGVETLILNLDDIEAYDAASHTLFLTDRAQDRLAGVGQMGGGSLGRMASSRFEMRLDGRAVYSGNFCQMLLLSGPPPCGAVVSLPLLSDLLAREKWPRDHFTVRWSARDCGGHYPDARGDEELMAFLDERGLLAAAEGRVTPPEGRWRTQWTVGGASLMNSAAVNSAVTNTMATNSAAELPSDPENE